MTSVATLVILTPLLAAMFLGVVQWGLRYHGEAMVKAAAQDGARAASHEGATVDEVQIVTGNVMASAVDGGFFTGPPAIDVVDDGVTVRVTVTAEVASPGLLPMTKTLRAVSEAPKEAFRAPV